MLFRSHDKKIIKTCCRRLSFAQEINYQEDNGIGEWACFGGGVYQERNIKFCPFCGVKLPQKEEIKKLIKVEQGFKYPKDDDGRQKMAESIKFHEKECRSEIKDFCDDPNHTLRCQALDNDSDNYSFGDQCNLAFVHDGEHAFGLGAKLWWVGVNIRCTEDEHFGDCSVCMVREVRNGHLD